MQFVMWRSVFRIFQTKHIDCIKQVEATREWDWMWNFETKNRFEPRYLSEDSKELILAANRIVVRTGGNETTVPVGIALFGAERKISVFGLGQPLTRWERNRLVRLIDRYIDKRLV